MALATFATIILPGILFISAFSLACPTIMWVPLYQFLFATPLQGLESMLLLLGIAILVLHVLWWYLRWYQGWS